MARRRVADDDDDGDDLPEGVYHDDELPTVACPYCRAEMLEELPQCPRCGSSISREDAPPERKSAFWIVMMLLALFCAALWAGLFN
jgi:uncharacterized paraquat-inducible protein A